MKKSKKIINPNLEHLRHSAAHLLAQAVLEIYPGTKMTIGPTINNGFFYDFLPPKNFTDDDLPRIEAKMKELSEKDYKIKGHLITKDEARKKFEGNEFKQELIDGIEDEKVGIYCQGNFCDLCRGGHVESTGKIKHFKLMSVAGSYWRANRENAALQRIYGIAFETSKELRTYLKQIEEAKKYDHRKIGKQQDLFSFHKEAPGTPFFHDKGLKIYNKLIEYMRHMLKNDYQEIKTPMILNESLWHTSGHYEHYKNNMYFTSVDNINYCIKPMNCPAGIMVYNEKPHSYKEFPLRVAEYGQVYRYELSGVLHGLFRVRSFTQDDAHIYCMPDQIVSEVEKMLELTTTVYNKFGFKDIKMAISTIPENHIGSVEVWDEATEALKMSLDNMGFDYVIQEGEGAFYGPKIEVVLTDAIGREWQCGTIQLDFFMPKNFNMKYIKADQTKDTPVMLHRAIYGSIERFMGILLEHYKGRLPFWLAPVQTRILTITDDVSDYAKTIFAKLNKNDIRVELDKTGDQISAQIKKAQLSQIPWMIIIGKKEQENGTVTLRQLDGKQEFGASIDDLIKRAAELNQF